MPKTAATVCLSGTLVDKLHACAAAGFNGIELFEPDLVVAPESPEEIRSLAERLGLDLVTARSASRWSWPPQGKRHPWMATLMPFFSMDTMPASLDPLRDAVREMVRNGWQPAEPEGPTRDQLADLVHEALAEPVPA